MQSRRISSEAEKENRRPLDKMVKNNRTVEVAMGKRSRATDARSITQKHAQSTGLLERSVETYSTQEEPEGPIDFKKLARTISANEQISFSNNFLRWYIQYSNKKEYKEEIKGVSLRQRSDMKSLSDTGKKIIKSVNEINKSGDCSNNTERSKKIKYSGFRELIELRENFEATESRVAQARHYLKKRIGRYVDQFVEEGKANIAPRIYRHLKNAAYAHESGLVDLSHAKDGNCYYSKVVARISEYDTYFKEIHPTMLLENKGGTEGEVLAPASTSTSTDGVSIVKTTALSSARLRANEALEACGINIDIDGFLSDHELYSKVLDQELDFVEVLELVGCIDRYVFFCAKGAEPEQSLDGEKVFLRLRESALYFKCYVLHELQLKHSEFSMGNALVNVESELAHLHRRLIEIEDLRRSETKNSVAQLLSHPMRGVRRTFVDDFQGFWSIRWLRERTEETVKIAFNSLSQNNKRIPIYNMISQYEQYYSELKEYNAENYLLKEEDRLVFETAMEYLGLRLGVAHWKY